MFLCNCGSEEPTEADLIGCIQQGGKCRDRAFERLDRQFAGLVSRAVRRAAALVADGEAVQAAALDDARQAARIALYAAAMRFDTRRPTPFVALAATYVDGAALRELRRQVGLRLDGATRTTTLTLVDEIPEWAIIKVPAAEDVVCDAGFGALTAAVADLSLQAQVLVAQVYEIGMTVSEVAAARDVRQQTVSAQHKRVLSRLCEIVENAA